MSTDNWREFVLLAMQVCPVVLTDAASMTAAEAYGVLLWLRRQSGFNGKQQ